MASQSLYRKWRSQTFSDLVGQEAIVETLKNELHNGKLAHAYLFTGPRGTGKTSTARLLAKTLNCTNSKNGEPCNVCEQCREITAGSSFNVIEIDAASNRGIDSIRELRDKVMIRPAQGKYKIYILDEAHMLTNEAFNALLKTLEEPPEHAIFVMATTDVHKMLPTVISRCQQFNFKRITTREIVKHLLFVAQEEHISIERGAADLIARTAAGGMRDALSLLDQAIAYSGQEITLTNVQLMLGVADVRAIQKIVTHIAHLESAAGLHLIFDLSEGGADLRQINTQVAEFIRGMMLSKAGANIAEILDSTEDQVQEITQLAQHFTLEELTDHARAFAQNDLMQKNQGNPQLGLELALLASIERHRVTTAAQGQQLLTSVAPVRQQPQQPLRPQQPSASTQSQARPPMQLKPEPVARKEETPVPLASPTPIARPVEPVAPVARSNEPEPDALPDWDDLSSYEEHDEEPDVPASPPKLTLVPPQKKPLVAAAEEDASSESGEGAEDTADVANVVDAVNAVDVANVVSKPTITVADIKEKWELIKRRIKTKKDGSMIAAVLNDYVVMGVEGSHELSVVVLRASAKFHYDTLQKDERRKVIEWALKIELNQECQVRLLPPGAPVITLPLPPTAQLDTGGRASNSGIALSPMPSAHRERPTSFPTPPTQPTSPVRTPLQEPEQQERINAAQQVPPLARMPDLRENTTSVTPSLREDVHSTPQSSEESSVRETRPEVLEKKAKTDPVVQEVMRMFKANIKEVHPKQ